MPVILKDRTTLDRERVVAEIGCTARLCGAPAGQACFGRDGRRVSPHLRRWHAWTARYSHLVLTKVSNKPSPAVQRAVDFVLAQNDDWDVLFPPVTATSGTVASSPPEIADLPKAYTDLFDVTSTTGGTQ